MRFSRSGSFSGEIGVGAGSKLQAGVTGALASIIFLTSTVAGLVYQGPVGFLKIFVPGGLPAVLVPVLFVLEFVGYFIKLVFIPINNIIFGGSA